MAAPKDSPAQRHLAAGLRTLKQLQDRGQVVVKSADLQRQERKALIESGFLQRVIKGWYVFAQPGEAPGDTTSWFSAMRAFVAAYCNARFGDE